MWAPGGKADVPDALGPVCAARQEKANPRAKVNVQTCKRVLHMIALRRLPAAVSNKPKWEFMIPVDTWVDEVIVPRDIPGAYGENEGCLDVVMEAMACGRAVVATDAGDVPYLVEDGKTDFVVCRGDDVTLVARMTTLITQIDLCRQMGEAGRVKTEREVELDRPVAETLATYRASSGKEI